MAPTLQEVLASRSNISNKVILTREMLECEDIVKTCLSNDADKARGYSHQTLDDNLKELIYWGGVTKILYRITGEGVTKIIYRITGGGSPKYYIG